MKRLSCIIATTLLSLAALAQTPTVNVGFCNGETATEGTKQLAGKGWVSAAVRLPASALTAYQGNNISAIRAALVQRINVDTLQVWVRSSLNGDNLAEGVITRNTDQSVSKGWNEVTLAAPLTISATMGDIYIGYSFHQRANVYGVSVVGDPLANTSYIKLGEADWQNISDEGVISLEAVVSGTALPKYDLGLVSATVSPWPQGGVNALRVTASVHNYGTETVNGFSVTCSANGATATQHVDASLASTASGTYTFVVDPGVATDDQTEWTVTISGIDDGTDENASNNSVQAVCSYLKNVLVEEFTTERCSQCPTMAANLHSALESSDDYTDRVFAVCHHAGFYTDSFTQPCDEDYLWFYNNNGELYAPALMIDRQSYFTVSGKSTPTPVYCPQSVEEITTYIDTDLALAANAMVGVTTELNADSTELTANVTCLRNDNLICESPRLTVYLIEDDVKAKQQASGASIDYNYYHQHVTRAYNSTWGEPVEWESGSYSYSCSFALDSTWKRNQMAVVAVLSNYNADDPNDCSVANVGSAKVLTDVVSGIQTPATAGNGTPVAYYNLSGQRIDKPAHGLYIVKRADGSTVKVLQ